MDQHLHAQRTPGPANCFKVENTASVMLPSLTRGQITFLACILTELTPQCDLGCYINHQIVGTPWGMLSVLRSSLLFIHCLKFMIISV